MPEVERSAAGLQCPIPADPGATILLSHGGGGRHSQRLLRDVIQPALLPVGVDAVHDSAVLAPVGARLAFTTDSYVVRPLFFPGGDIGVLAVNGTVNDLAMAGARPLALSLSLILEEGLPIELLRRVLASISLSAGACGVQVVTGDTKVVERGAAPGMFVTTSGIGAVETSQSIGPQVIRPGDRVLVSGDLGRHGIAVLAARNELQFETTVESDTAPLAAPVMALLAAGVSLHCLRDLTRGGLAAALWEIAQSSGLGIRVEEATIPVGREVRAACELLGMDATHIANEGRFVAFVPPEEAPQALTVLRSFSPTAACIGEANRSQRVTLSGVLGVERLMDYPSGELLPRIC